MTKDSMTEIESVIRKKAASYTPEWRFDTDNPDIGSALAIVYARMMEQTVKKLSRIPVKNRVVFLNSIGADLLPAIPSEGFVSMSLVNEEVSAVDVPTKTAVIAESEDAPDGMVVFETSEAMCATPALITDIIVTDGKEDRIEERETQAFFPFHDDGINQQKHEFYFSHDTVLYLNNEADIELTLECQGGRSTKQEDLKLLTDPSRVVYEYATGEDDDWERISFVEAPYGYLHLRKEEDQPPFSLRTIEEAEGYWLRMRMIGEVPAEPIVLDRVRLSTKCKEMIPDAVINTEGECSVRRLLPFGERLSLYDEIYFGSEEVFSKKGAQITLSFRVDFARVPLDTTEREPFNWEWVMRRNEFKQDLEFDVTIESVIWEYYNGAGWTRLFADNAYSRMFSVPDDVSGQFQTMRFTMPENMERVLVGARDTFFIRARILKINNLYKQNGNYVLPVVENISMKYSYNDSRKAQFYRILNNMELREGAEDEFQPMIPFEAMKEKNKMCYFGFETPPKGSPIKMLLDIAGGPGGGNKRLRWEYFSKKGFRNLNPVDETNGLTKTGIVTFTGGDFVKKRFFGKDRYWIRLVDEDNRFRDGAKGRSPFIRSIHMNTTKVIQVTGRRTEYFQMEIYEKDKSFSLLDRNVYRILVDVDEIGMLDEREELRLKEQGLLEEERSEDGALEHLWVRWNEVPDFFLSGKEDRHYICHAREGRFQFGNGVHGRIPAPSGEQNIRVRYRTAGGGYTNMPPDSITHSEHSLGYVSRVYNPLALTGGCDPETLSEGVSRNSMVIRHQNRAVTASDYEALAMTSSRDVRMVKCFTGYDDEGTKKNGAVTLVVLGQSGQNGEAGFDDLKERIMSNMRGCISPHLIGSGRFFITEPAFVEIRLYIELTVESYEMVFDVRETIQSRLAALIAPKLSPDEPGFEIGDFPGMIQIQNAVSDINGIVSIKKIVMNTYVAGVEGDMEVDIETMKKRRYILPTGGEHEIVIHANQ